METVYCLDFSPLKTFSIRITKELSGKISESVLHIEVRSNKFELYLKNPKVHSISSKTFKEVFSNISPKNIKYLRVLGNHHKPDSTLWSIEFGNDSPIVTIHCSTIDGLPKEGWKNI
jgi:hypothetical protein